VNLVTKVRGQLRGVAKIRAIGIVAQRPMNDTLGQLGRLVAISCAKSTQPFGTGEDARTAGRNRVAADIYKIYTTIGKAFEDISKTNPKAAGAFWSALQRGDFDKAQGILRKDGVLLRNVPLDRFDDGALHRAKRQSQTGRVTGLKTPLMVVRNPRQLAAYIKKRQDLVGFAKSAWANIARQLGSIRGLRAAGDITANWITRNGGLGSIAWLGTKAAPLLRLTSHVKYGDRVLPQHERGIAVNIARGRIAKMLQAAVSAEMRKQLR